MFTFNPLRMSADKLTLSFAPLIMLLSVPLLSVGCASVHYDKTEITGEHTTFRATSFLSNSALKGASVDRVTKTTSEGMKLSGSTTEPNPDAIVASGDAMGQMIGTAVKAAAK